MKKYLLTIASLLAMVSVTGFAQLGSAVAEPGKTMSASAHGGQALSEATVQTGKLKPVTAKRNARRGGKVVVAARPSARTGPLHSMKAVSRHRVTTRAKVAVSPWGTGVSFQNSYGKTVWVAVEYANPNCSLPGIYHFENVGWYRLDPGQSKRLFTTTSRYAYWYADATDGATWSGSYSGKVNPKYAYDYCNSLDSSAADYGMRQIDLGNLNYLDSTSFTVTLIP